MKVLFLTGSAPAHDAAAMDRLAQEATDLQITLVDSPSSALAEIRRARGFHALLTSPTVPQTDALTLIVSLRRDAVPIAIVPIVTEVQQSFYASAVASGADDVLLLRGEQFVNLRETLTRIRQSPHLRPAADRRRLRALYAGKDTVVWHLLGQIPFVAADRATVSPDGVTPIRMPGDANSALRCDVVVIDEAPGEAHALQILKSVKAQASDLPVVMLTGPAAGDVETAALDLGADDIVVKSGVFRRRLVATLRHVHQRLELVEQHTTLRTRAERLRQILETMPAGLTIVSGDGTVLAINAAAQALIGAAKPTDVVGRPFVSLAIDDHRADVTQTLRTIGAGESAEIVFDVLGVDGRRRTIELHGVMLERDARGTRGVIAVLQPPIPAGDSASTEEIRAELEDARQALSDAEGRQDDKVFDDLYFIGTQIHSAWALTTSDGIIVIDTLFDYAIGPEIVDGMTTLGLDPRNIKYVLISHAHGDHDQGAALLQSRYGAKVVMGTADWDATAQRPATAAGGVPKRDVAVGADGMKLTLGGTTVNIVATPGHSPGTLSFLFPVKDGGRTLTVAYSGGTAFNFPRLADNFAIYRDSATKMLAAATAAGATVLMTNHTEFDRAWDRARLAQLPRAAGEPHPYETDAATVQRYFAMQRDCAESQRLTMN